MAALTVSTVTGAGVKTVTVNTLTSSDTFTYQAGDIMYLRNGSGGALTLTLDGADGTTVGVEGVGDVSVASGYSTGSIANGAERVIFLDTIRHYLQGTVTVTGGTGMSCTIMRR